jgi:UDP-N-acetylmuramoyl-tripeptide--D-alanyl-D-alanine ligase
VKLGVVIIKVPDTLKALGNLARYYRNIVSAKIIAITGSNGKTTTKEMLAHILSGQGLTASSPKSFNNFIGVPLTIFSIGKKHRYGVLELGTNNPGEIAYLTGIVRPDIAIITNIAPAHLAGLKSVMGVAREKFSLFRALTPQGTAIFPGDNKILKRFTRNAEYNIETFSQTSKASIRALDVISSKRGVVRLLERSELQPTIPGSNSLHSNCQRIEFKVISSGRGKYPVRLSLLGNWNVDNALAAITAAKAVGVPVQDACRALSSFQPPAMRMQQEDINGITVINDAYNANPASVACAIGELSRMPSEGRKIFVFGEMRELGRQAEKYHRAVGRGIARSNIDALITVGKSTRWTLRALPKGASLFRAYCNNVNEVIVRLKRILRKGDTVLLKGSRAVGLEKIGAEL